MDQIAKITSKINENSVNYESFGERIENSRVKKEKEKSVSLLVYDYHLQFNPLCNRSEIN